MLQMELRGRVYRDELVTYGYAVKNAVCLCLEIGSGFNCIVGGN